MDRDLARFMSKVIRLENGCLEWQAGLFDDGYPGFFCGGKTLRGNRWALERSLGRPLRKGMQSLHHCDNKRCVNTDHLYEGTHQDNMDDLRERGQARGIPKSEAWRAKMRVSMLGNTNGKRNE